MSRYVVQQEVEAVRILDFYPFPAGPNKPMPDWVRKEFESGNLVFGHQFLVVRGPDKTFSIYFPIDSWLIRDAQGNLTGCPTWSFEARYKPVEG